VFDTEAGISDSSLEPVEGLSGLGSLDLYATWRKPDRDPTTTSVAFRKLAGLHLGRFGFHQALSSDEIRDVCSLQDLEELELGDLAVTSLGEGDLAIIRNLPKLRCLKLPSFDATQPAWRCITQVRGLRRLDAGYTEVDDTDVPRFSELQHLRSLRIGVIGPNALSVLADLPELEELDILRFSAGTTKPDFSIARRVTWLRIGAVSGERARNIALPKGLQRLDVDYGTIPQLDLRSAGEVGHIQVDLAREYRYRNVNTNLDHLSACRKLKELDLQDPTASDVKAVASITSLSDLALVHQDECSTTGDDGVRHVAALKNLKSLIIQDFQSGDGAIDAGMDILLDFPNLRRLELAGLPGMSEKRLDAVLVMKDLRSLKLNLTSRPKMDSLLAKMDALTKLEELSVGGTVSDDGLASLASLKSLRVLDLTRAEGYSTKSLASLMSSLPGLHEVRFAVSAKKLPKVD
jgi:Leucine-rich repeat (LRR) protein